MDETLTKIEVEHRLEITPMTLYLWQKGQGQWPVLPCIKVPKGERNAIFFDYKTTKNWLQQYRPNLVKKLEKPCECKRCEKTRGTQASISPKPEGSNSVVAAV